MFNGFIPAKIPSYVRPPSFPPHFVFVLALGCAFLGSARGGEKRKPNVIIILADDQGNADAGFQPHGAFVRTPNLDRLAQRGVVCSNGYASSSMCTPSRAGLLTGKYPSRLGMYDVGDALVGFPRGEELMPEYFKKAGYATALIGKWHLGGELEDYNYPLNKGFDRFWGFLDSTHDYWKADTGSSLIYGHEAFSPIYDQREEVEKIDYLTRDITRKSVEFIEANKDKPFFLYVAYNAAHVPLQVPKDVYDKYGATGYGEKAKVTRAIMEVLDEGVGGIARVLETLGLTKDTIVIYSSDNGGGEPDGQLNGEMRGGKFTFWEGGIRVPTIVSWPGHLPEGEVYRQPVINIDFLPTVLAAAGISPQAGVEGVDLLPFFRGETKGAPHESLHWSLATAKKDFAIRSGDWKLVRTGGGNGLFNLQEDPSEERDVSREHPDVLARLWDQHLAWTAKNQKTLATPEVKARVKQMGDPAKEAPNYQYSATFGGNRK